MGKKILVQVIQYPSKGQVKIKIDESVNALNR